MAEARTALDETPPPVGFAFPVRDVDVSTERQRRRLACCRIDADIWENAADPTFFAFYTIMAQRWTGRSINGNVHMSQVYRLNAGLPLDTPMTMSGEVRRIDPHPRGNVVYADFAFKAPDGSTPLLANRSSLNPGVGDPEAPRRTMTPVPMERMAPIHEMQMEPDLVASFSDEGSNLIHSDPETAKKFGFRAPIAGGLMGSHIMLGGLILEASAGPVTQLDAEISFLRPMFWDDRLRLFATPRGDAGPRHLALVGDDDKIRCRGSVDRIAFGRSALKRP